MATDADLLDRWGSGDDRAASELIDRHTGRLRRFFHTKTDAEVDDLIQQTLLTCLQARAKIPNAASFRAYMFTVARNVLYNHYRKNRRMRERFDPLETSFADLHASPSQVIYTKEWKSRLMAALRTLPVDLQVALELRFWEQLSGPELAEVLDVPEGTVRSRLRRGMTLLRAALGGQEISESDFEASSPDFERWARQDS